ncbi:hypothetical protein Tco_0330950 [Tanacetum coccineum]
MGDQEENDVTEHVSNETGQGEKGKEKVKDKKKKDKKEKKEKKEKNPEDKKDPAKLKAKLEKIDSKIQALNVQREEILKLLQEVQANAPAL